MSYDPILNPISGTASFGRIQSMKLAGEDLPDAEIHLYFGRHIGPNRGFGACHIWAEHRGEMARIGLHSEAEVSQFVVRIVRTGTPLFYEGASWTTARLMAVRSASGQAILEFRRQRNGAIWSVVTAFAGKKTHGTLVGTVR